MIRDRPLARRHLGLGLRPGLAAALSVAAAALFPYLGSLFDPPILDDGRAALENPLVHGLRNAGRIFANPSGHSGAPSVRGLYRPLTTLSYALNWSVHRGFLPGFHAVNLALHAASSVLVSLLAFRLARAGVPARAGRVSLLAGLLFALHPAHVEAVVTISGRAELLSTLCALLALLLALPGLGSPVHLALSTLVLALGILSEEMAAMTPALFLLVAAGLPSAAGLPAPPGLRRGEARRALFRAVGAAVVLCLAVLPYALLGRPSGATLPRFFPLATPVTHIALTMSRVLFEYLRILVFPSFLGGPFAYADRIPTLSAPTFGFAVATFVWMGVLAAGVLLLRRAPLAGVGLVFVFLALLPVLQIVPLGVLLEERLLYLPSVGFCLLAASALAALLPEPTKDRTPQWSPSAALRAGAVAAVLLALFARTVVRTRDFTSELSFWESELGRAPYDAVVNSNLGMAYVARGEPEKAIPRLEAALAAHPGYWRAWMYLGIARDELAERPASRAAFEEAMRLAPAESDPPRFMARMLRRAGDLDGAISALEKARRSSPEEAVLARELAAALLEAGRPDEARDTLREAIRLDPGDLAAGAELSRLPP